MAKAEKVVNKIEKEVEAQVKEAKKGGKFRLVLLLVLVLSVLIIVRQRSKGNGEKKA